MGSWWPFRARSRRNPYADALGEARQSSTIAIATVHSKRREFEAALEQMMTTNEERRDDARPE
tara:strand:- start:365 stop:553 length:189 start_codon:yes stop_codon:yes gene_type:complete